MEPTPITKKQVIEDIETYLNTTEIYYEAINKKSHTIYNRTTRIIYTVFISIGVLLFINSYFIYDFGVSVVSMMTSMEDMYKHFGNMSTQVHGISESVAKMTIHIDGLPIMAESINSMNDTVINMNTNVQSMQGEVKLMANNIGSINQNITDMTYNFEQVTKNMNTISHDVNQMSSMMPF